MRNLIILFITFMLVWIFPARWGAQFFFPEMMAQFSSQVPYLMGWGALMFLLATVITACLAHD
ncbi:membrane protein [Cronobacter phage CR3]|uniref:Uncharacterized protein n=1 Tax=Cronobacter phage CR3 TaxID=1162295 RepID=I1TRC8_9CAUD|nr:membrane protein [Cronobacter phage CR3]AFH21251.1 hypothetical protein CR3_086 [Cronobacter phage CR3]KAB3178520.1 hypothetical protein F9047_11370 [Escherichia coli]UTC25284.1 hypothetical protein P7_094 [Pectobacterium phage vB_PcaM_P7_Pc]